MEALKGLRVGAVSYLNTKPLIAGLDHLYLDIPARLAAAFSDGDLDVALLPVFEVLRGGGGRVVDQVAIASDGAVYSVIVASQHELAASEEIYLDPASRTSALLKVLAAEYYPHLRIREGSPPDGAARLLIGDPAIEFHRQPHGWLCHDLGALWREQTGLPFVFAVWALGPKVTDPVAVGQALREVKAHGLANRRALADGLPDPDFAWTYLTESIRYDLGALEKKAIKCFTELAVKHHLISVPTQVEYL